MLRERERLTKYSDVLPEASLTPPLNTIVEEVVCVCGVCDRVAGVVVPLRIVVPLSQLPALLLPDDIEREKRSRHPTMSSSLPVTRPAWQDRLATLPGDPDHIPAFFFAHGSPLLTMSNNNSADWNPQMRAIVQHGGLESPFANFLRDLGPALLAKYQPKAILVFSAHWETEGERLGT